jgi:2-polyprenyl-3-methyl-5-hydroxy-6-metoxy-1,4-benzoquinol methylase
MLNERATAPEMMDDLSVQGETVHQALKEIQLVNKWLGGHRVTLQGLEALIHHYPSVVGSESLKLADIGCGGGEMLQEIHRWGQQNGYELELYGIDANPNIIDYARHQDEKKAIHWLTEDILSESFQQHSFDIINAAMFLHHFSNEELVTLLQRCYQQVRYGMVINDLHRHPVAYYSIKMLTKLFSKSKMVKNDAPLSVHKGFTRSDWHNLLQQAGITCYHIKWRWAFRHQILIFKK